MGAPSNNNKLNIWGQTGGGAKPPAYKSLSAGDFGVGGLSAPPLKPLPPGAQSAGRRAHKNKLERAFIQDPADQTKFGTGENQANNVSQQLMAGPSRTANAFDKVGGQFENPFAGEAAMAGQLNNLSQPGMNETYATGVAAKNNIMTTGLNDASQYYKAFQENRPEVNYEAGLDPYYDLAKDRLLEETDRWGASRGAYGSSAALGMGQRGLAELGADQAKNEADYYLKALGEARNWDALGGQLADRSQGARREWTDTLGGVFESGQGSQLDREGQITDTASLLDKATGDRLAGFGDFAGAADEAELARLGGAAEAAIASQNLGDKRVQTAYENKNEQMQFLTDLVNGTYGDIFGGNKEMLDEITRLMLGETAENKAGADAGAQGVANAASAVVDTAGTGADVYDKFKDD
jgi:hypothetical protein